MSGDPHGNVLTIQQRSAKIYVGGVSYLGIELPRIIPGDRSRPGEVGHKSSTESSVQGLLFEMPVEIFDEEDIAQVQSFPQIQLSPPGPLVDNLGEQWDEQRTNDHLPFWYARSLSGSWIPKNGMDGFGNTDVPITTSFAPIWFDEVPAFLITPGFGFHFWEAPDALELPSRVFDSYIEVTWRTPVTDRWGFAFGMTSLWRL